MLMGMHQERQQFTYARVDSTNSEITMQVLINGEVCGSHLKLKLRLMFSSMCDKTEIKANIAQVVENKQQKSHQKVCKNTHDEMENIAIWPSDIQNKR